MSPITAIMATFLSLFLTTLLTEAQELPRRKDHHFLLSHAEIVHDTGTVPDGVEVRTYIFKDTTKRYFFSVDEDNTPVSITVTPCAALLEWQLSLLPHEESEEPSGDDIAEEFEEQMPNLRTDSPNLILKSYIGFKRETYLVHDSPAGEFMLQIRSPETDTNVYIYATTSPDSDRPYPELPTDPRLDVASVNRDSVTLGWKASPTNALHQEPIKYCVTANTKTHFDSLCGFQSFYGLEPPPALPPNFGFGFEFEMEIIQRHREIERRYRQKSREIRKHDYHIECVGTKTQHTFLNLLPSKQYYFDLFVVNRVNNYSSTYVGVSLKTKKRNQHKIIDMKDGKLVTTSVKKSNSPKSFRYRVFEHTDHLLFTVHPCSAQVHAEIWKDDEMVQGMDIADLSNITFNDVTPGEYFVKLSNSRRRPTSVKVLATRRLSKYPYPVMPDDTRIIEFERGRKCDSVTLAWLATKGKALYCLYKREIKQETRRSSNTNTCHGPELRKKTEKMFCRHNNDRNSNGKTAPMSEMVSGLSPGTTYRFDVYVDSYGSETLPYDSIWVTTKDQC
ncbi:protein NDNF-like [Saccoglossus kowalevskii]|uniref:Protein NDNF n=1 Tax=Saccoglossus kowalevskii TaxID=10224 RepID=A0ABM0MYJ0_SACKO|nr:PREDICTED: protein NDNF-like [Saccoglossus kowalevskii]